MCSNEGHHLPKLKLIDSCLRLCILLASVASIYLTLSDYQNISSYGTLSFHNFSGLKYMVSISFISAIYAVISAICSWIAFLVSRPCFFFVFDQLVAYMMMTSLAAVLEILYLSYNGDKEVSWSEACSTYGRFCSRLKMALIFHGISFCFFLVLAVMSAFRAFSLYEPPCKDEPRKFNEEEAHVVRA